MRCSGRFVVWLGQALGQTQLDVIRSASIMVVRSLSLMRLTAAVSSGR